MKDFRIIYMGTPDFAVYPLKRLVDGGYNVVGVVTMPDKPAGRGQKLSESAVKKYASEKGLNILQPEKLKDEAFIQSLKALNADLGIVVAFKMLPEVVWSMPRMGTFNLHGSLLPDYRGAAPINWAIINGDTVTGVTTFMLDHKIDTGEVIDFKQIDILPEDNAGTIHDKLMFAGGDLVIESVDKIIEGRLETQSQSEFKECKKRPAPKIFKDDCKISWSNKCNEIHNLVRGLSPYPAAWMDFGNAYGNDVSMKIFKTKVEIVSHSVENGTVECDGKNYLKIAVSDGFIHIQDCQLSGKKRMDIKSLLRGCQAFTNIK